MATKLKQEDYDLLTSAAFKLKDSPENRRTQLIDLSKQFPGRKPPTLIVIEKVAGRNNTLVLRAFVEKLQDENKTA
jgi:hypothetical protein